jgi:hypothetical protein
MAASGIRLGAWDYLRWGHIKPIKREGTQGIRKKSNLIRNRYEFQTDHGLRKWFKTTCELSGTKR